MMKIVRNLRESKDHRKRTSGRPENGDLIKFQKQDLGKPMEKMGVQYQNETIK